MDLKKRFTVARPRDEVVERLCCDETLLDLMSRGETEIVESRGDHRTTRTRYTALGREGVATFRFTFLNALILGESAAAGGNPEILLKRDGFNPGIQYEVLMGGEPPHVRLEELVERGEDYDRVRVAWLKGAAA